MKKQLKEIQLIDLEEQSNWFLFELVPDSVDGDEFYKGQTKEVGIIDQICKSSSPDELPLIQLDNAAPHTGNHMKERLEDFIKKTQ